MEEQTRRIVEKHTKLMGVQYGLRIAFFLKGTPTYHNHWVCEFNYRKDHSAAIRQIEKPTIQELLDAVEAEINWHLTTAST
jgi:hypothetical protein